MNRLLTTDQNIFIDKYPEAEAFLIAAHLRYECFNIMCKPFSALTGWEKNRLVELFNAPACNTQGMLREKEHWYKRNIESRDYINQKYA